MSSAEIIASLTGKRVLIIGDVMIDAYIWGEHNRMSPEAPVPVVDVANREARLGGAANVALNIKAMGAEAIILSVVGNKGRSEEYHALMTEQGLSDIGLVNSRERRCTVKTRVISNEKHMMRVDEEDTFDLTIEEERNLLDRFTRILDMKQVDVIILQDYNKGVLSPKVIEQVIAESSSKGIPTMVDPKRKNFSAYRGCTLFKPNLKELREGLGSTIESLDRSTLDSAVAELQKSMPHAMTMVTLSEHGVYWNSVDGSGVIPVFERDIVDVSGAGDTVISVAALVLAAGGTLSQAALIANLAGGLVCEQVGVQPIDKEALYQQILSQNIE